MRQDFSQESLCSLWNRIVSLLLFHVFQALSFSPSLVLSLFLLLFHLFSIPTLLSSQSPEFFRCGGLSGFYRCWFEVLNYSSVARVFECYVLQNIPSFKVSSLIHTSFCVLCEWMNLRDERRSLKPFTFIRFSQTEGGEMPLNHF